ncbi:MAG: YjzC family protein [Erysipelotrichaceae bacterium]
MAKTKKYHSGMTCEKKGQYKEYDSNGKVVNESVDMDKGDSFPPTSEKGSYFVQ